MAIYEFKYAPGDKLIGSGFEGEEIERIIISEDCAYYSIVDNNFRADKIESDESIEKT